MTIRWARENAKKDGFADATQIHFSSLFCNMCDCWVIWQLSQSTPHRDGYQFMPLYAPL